MAKKDKTKILPTKINMGSAQNNNKPNSNVVDQEAEKMAMVMQLVCW